MYSNCVCVCVCVCVSLPLYVLLDHFLELGGGVGENSEYGVPSLQ